MPNKVNDIAGNGKSVCFHLCEAHIEHRRGDQFSLSNLYAVCISSNVIGPQRVCWLRIIRLYILYQGTYQINPDAD